MSNPLAKKFFASAVALATVLTGFAPLAARAAVTPGEVYKTTDGTVWFVTSDMQKRPFTSGGAFLSYGFLSFSQVKDATAEVTALPTGSFVAPRDGGIFCATETKGSDVKGECALITGGKKARFTSASVFTGQGFSFSRAQNGDSSFLENDATNIDNTASAHRPGVLVNNSGTVQLVVNGGLWGIPSIDVFNSWGYSFADVVPANGADKVLTQIGVIPARIAGQLNPTGVSTPTQTGPLSVGLSSDNPAASTLVATQALADLAHFSFTGSGTLSAVTFERIGVSANTTLSNVYLFDGATRLTDSAAVGSDNKVTFAGLNLAVNGSRNIAFKSDILTGTSGQTVGVRLVSYTVSGGSATSVSVSGNLHTIASATLAAVAMSNAQTIADFDPANDVTVFQGTATVSTRNVTLTRLALRQIGSIQSADIKNLRLFVDGTQIATAASLDSNGYVTFTSNTTLTTGARIIKVVADVIGGSGRTLQMSLRVASDIGVVDSSYLVNVLSTGTFPFGDSTTAAINAGYVTVEKAANSAASNVVSQSSDQSLGTYTFTAYGESVKVETLRVGMLGTTSGTITDHTLRNVRVMVNGSQVGSTTDVPFAAAFAAASGTSFTTNFYVVPGTPTTVEIRGDIYDSEGTEEIGTGVLTAIQAVLVGGTATSNAVPQVSLGTINVPSSTNVTANSLTVGSSTIALAATTTYPSQNITAPQSSFKMGSFTLTGNATEAVNINTIDVGFVGGDTFDPSDDLSNAFLKVDGVQSSVKGSVTDGTSTSLATSWSVNKQLGINQTITIEVWATIGSSITAAGSNDTMLTYMRVTGNTAVSGTTVYADTDSDTDNTDAGKSGQTLTVESGSITATRDASSPDAQIVDDSGTVTTVAWKFAAVTDSYTITDLSFSLGSATAVSQVAIKDGSTTIATKPAATSMSFSGLSIPVAANTNKVLTVELTMSTIGVAAGTTDSDLTTTMVAFTARNSAGTSAAGTESNPAGQAMYAYKAIPTVTQVSLPNSDLAAGTYVIAKFTVSSGGTGTIAWKQIMLEITKTATPVLAAPTLWNSDTQTQITAAVAYQNGTAGVATTCSSDNTFCEALITVGTNADDDTMETISGARTYEVRAAITGSIATTDSVSVKLDRNTSSHAASAAEQTNDNATTAGSVSFVWSDESASATNDTGVSTWQKDYLVKNLPINWNLN